MNHCVPDFETDNDYLFPASSNSKRHKKSAMGDDDIMELLWQNGQVVMQSQNQRSAGGGNKKSETTPSTAGREIRSGSGVIEDETTPCNLFMQEDEMVSWLHYPSDDNNSLDLYLHNNDILYPVLPSTSIVPVTTVPSSLPPPPPLATVPPPPPRPPIPPLKRVEEEPSQPKFANFLHFSRPNKGGLTAGGSGPSSSNQISQAITQSTVVESNIGCRGSMSSFGGAGTSSAGTGREPETCDVSASSSPGTGGSGASASVEPSSHKPSPATHDRKRKGRDTDDTECYSEELEFEYHDLKKKSRGSASSTKRSRAAEVHNLSERRRRDRINEKMKALQELIPRCNKSDKASMLDEAIEYLKSLQMQVQMMSMGYSMVPMMFPGVQRYMPTMAAMGMGMGMDHRGMVPYPSVPPMPNSAAQQCFPVPRFQMAQVPIMAHQPRGDNPSDHPMMNSFPPTQNANQPRVPFVDPYQQCLGLPQTQLPQQQNQTGMGGVTSKPSSSKDVRYPHRHPTG